MLRKKWIKSLYFNSFYCDLIFSSTKTQLSKLFIFCCMRIGYRVTQDWFKFYYFNCMTVIILYRLIKDCSWCNVRIEFLSNNWSDFWAWHSVRTVLWFLNNTVVNLLINSTAEFFLLNLRFYNHSFCYTLVSFLSLCQKA